MNPNSGENLPKFEVPAAPEQGNNDSHNLEKGAVRSPENKPQKQAVQISSQVASDLALPAQSISTPTAVADDDTQADHKTAKEVDRIEKEWIDKAKAIVIKTQDDPHAQKNAMSQVKAEYIKKRFNKTVKVDDTASK